MCYTDGREVQRLAGLVKDGMKTIYQYGIACYRKRCRVVSESIHF